MRRLGIERAPAALWVYVFISVVESTVSVAIEVPKHLGFALLYVAVAVFFTVLLLRGSRVIWWLIVGFGAFSLLTVPFLPPPWWSTVLNVLELALLLAPATRRFIFKPRPALPVSVQANLDPQAQPDSERAAGWSAGTGPPQESWDPHRDADADRPRGWYVDPGSPEKMRYWAGEPTGWTGSARTPLKIRKAWREGSDPGAEADAG